MLSHIDMPVKVLTGREAPYDGDRRFVRPLKASVMRKPRRKKKKVRRAPGAAAADDDDAEVPHKSICLVCLGNELVEKGICITAGDPTRDWMFGDKEALTIIAMKAVQKSGELGPLFARARTADRRWFRAAVLGLCTHSATCAPQMSRQPRPRTSTASTPTPTSPRNRTPSSWSASSSGLRRRRQRPRAPSSSTVWPWLAPRTASL